MINDFMQYTIKLSIDTYIHLRLKSDNNNRLYCQSLQDNYSIHTEALPGIHHVNHNRLLIIRIGCELCKNLPLHCSNSQIENGIQVNFYSCWFHICNFLYTDYHCHNLCHGLTAASAVGGNKTIQCNL